MGIRERVSTLIESLAVCREKSIRKSGLTLDLRAPIQPLFAQNTENDSGNSSLLFSSEPSASANTLKKLAAMHYEWALDNYSRVRARERQEQGNPASKRPELETSSPYLSYLSSQYDGVDSPVVGAILEHSQGHVVMESILLLFSQNSSAEYGAERFKDRSPVMLLLSDILRGMKRVKTLHFDTMDFHVLVDILFREMVIMRDLGFALFEYVSCLNIVIKCIASTKEKYRWGEATSLLSVTESLIEGFGVASL
ncbi:Folate receptor-like protein [Cryptosporidium felis]|nr:Folate receptor-like protein [Cryptosporidium felis]